VLRDAFNGVSNGVRFTYPEDAANGVRFTSGFAVQAGRIAMMLRDKGARFA